MTSSQETEQVSILTTPEPAQGNSSDLSLVNYSIQDTPRQFAHC